MKTHDASGKSDAQLFWIVKNDVSFSGMPGFGSQYSDAELAGIVSYVRAIQNGQAQPVSVSTPTPQQWATANPTSNNPAERGAAVYFAEGCQDCHGAVGNAPGNLALRGGGETGAIRRGRPGMPAYGTSLISNQQLSDLQAYLRSWPGSGRGGRESENGSLSSTDQ